MFPSMKVVASAPASVILLDDLTTTCAAGGSLHKKEHIALNSWLSLICARSRDLLKTWSRVEPFGYFYKGYQQPAVSTLSGGATCDIRTVWKNQDELYTKCMPTFNETLQGESCMGGAVDNFNRLCPIKNQIDNKSSINHIGTAFFCKKDKPFEIAKDTIMTEHSVADMMTQGTGCGMVSNIVFAFATESINSVRKQRLACAMEWASTMQKRDRKPRFANFINTSV